jgi:WD40 repeat protein
MSEEESNPPIDPSDNEFAERLESVDQHLADSPGTLSDQAHPIDPTFAYRTEGQSIAILKDIQAQPLIISDAHAGFVGDLVFSPRGTRILSCGWDSSVRIWDAASGERVMDLQGHQHSVWSVAWSPDGQRLATGDDHGVIKIWDASTGTLLASGEQHTAVIRDLEFLPDSSQLASASADNTVKLWNTTTGRLLRSLRGHFAEVTSLQFIDQGHEPVSASIDGQVKRWDLRGTGAGDLLEHPDNVSSLAFSFDGGLIATACVDGQIRFWNPSDGKSLFAIDAHQGVVWRVQFLMLGGWLAAISSGGDGAVRIWDVSSREMLKEFPCYRNPFEVVALAVSADSSKIAFPDSRFDAIIWDLTSDSMVAKMTIGTADALQFSADGKKLLVGSGPFCSFWDVATGIQEIESVCDARRVPGISITPDGKTFSTASYDRTVKIWQYPASGATELSLLRDLKGHAGPVWSVAHSPDGSVIASCAEEPLIRLWDVSTGQQRAAFSGHTGDVTALAFSPDGEILASASNDYTVRLWRAPRDTDIATTQAE